MVKELPNMSWAGLLLEVHRAVVEVMEGGGKRDQPLLVQLLNQAKENLKEESLAENVSKFMQKFSNSKSEKKLCLAVSCCLCLSLSSISNPEQCLTHIANALSHCYSHPNTLLARLVMALLPAGATPPQVGVATIGVELDWQCQWQALSSIQASEALATVCGRPVDTWLNEEKAEELADAFMLEDIIYLQKLQAELLEAEEEVAKMPFKADDDELVNGCEVGGEKEKNIVTSNRPNTVSMTFYERFVEGNADGIEARKELQKLRWLLSRTRKPGVPFPDLTDCCSCLLVLLEKEKVGDDPPSDEVEEEDLLVRKQEEDQPGLRRRVARWAFANGVRKQQKFFLERW